VVLDLGRVNLLLDEVVQFLLIEVLALRSFFQDLALHVRRGKPLHPWRTLRYQGPTPMLAHLLLLLMSFLLGFPLYEAVDQLQLTKSLNLVVIIANPCNFLELLVVKVIRVSERELLLAAW